MGNHGHTDQDSQNTTPDVDQCIHTIDLFCVSGPERYAKPPNKTTRKRMVSQIYFRPNNGDGECLGSIRLKHTTGPPAVSHVRLYATKSLKVDKVIQLKQAGSLDHVAVPRQSMRQIPQRRLR